MSNTYTMTIPPTQGLNINGAKAVGLAAAQEFFCDPDETHFIITVEAKKAGYGTTQATIKVTHEIPAHHPAIPVKFGHKTQAFSTPALSECFPD